MITQQKAKMNNELLSVLACPKCKGDVKNSGSFLLCKTCKLAFPVMENKIPDMLLEDAWDLDKAKRHGFRHNFRLTK